MRIWERGHKKSLEKTRKHRGIVKAEHFHREIYKIVKFKNIQSNS